MRTSVHKCKLYTYVRMHARTHVRTHAFTHACTHTHAHGYIALVTKAAGKSIIVEVASVDMYNPPSRLRFLAPICQRFVCVPKNMLQYFYISISFPNPSLMAMTVAPHGGLCTALLTPTAPPASSAGTDKQSYIERTNKMMYTFNYGFVGVRHCYI